VESLFPSIDRFKSIGHVSSRELLPMGDSAGTRKPLPPRLPVTVVNIKPARLQTVVASQILGTETIIACYGVLEGWRASLLWMG
jgi:hypothetical protein